MQKHVYLAQYNKVLSSLIMSANHIRAAFLLPCFEVIEELGLDPKALIELVALSNDVFDSPESLVPLSAAIDLVEIAAKETKCHHLGLLLGARVSIQSLGLLGLLLRSASTFKAAINDIIKHLTLNMTGLKRSLTVDRGIAILSSAYDSPQIALSRQARQISISLGWNLIQSLSSERWQPISISFSFAEPEDAVFYRKFFKTRVYFNADYDGIAFHEADLKIELTSHDEYLHQTIAYQVAKMNENKHKNDFVEEVKSYVAKNLEIGLCSENEVLKFFPMQKRTFQNRLKEQGTSYQNILDDLRFKKAELYLGDSTLKMYQVADLLCYKSGGAFAFAFNKRYGMSPSKWKHAQK